MVCWGHSHWGNDVTYSERSPRGVQVSENLRKLIGVVVMAVLVVVGVAVSSGDDTNFTRNIAFGKGAQVPGLGDGKKFGDDGPYDLASAAYIVHFQEVLPASGGDDSWFLHNDRYSTLDLICFEGAAGPQLLARVSPTQGPEAPLRAHGVVSRRVPDEPVEEGGWLSGWFGQRLPPLSTPRAFEPQDVRAIEPQRQPLVGPWSVPLTVGVDERARFELLVFATTPEGKPLGASNVVIRVSGNQDACEVDGVILRSYE